MPKRTKQPNPNHPKDPEFASVEQLQEIQHLEKGLIIQGNLINTFVSTGMTSFIYSLLLVFLEHPSYFRNIQEKALDEYNQDEPRMAKLVYDSRQHVTNIFDGLRATVIRQLNSSYSSFSNNELFEKFEAYDASEAAILKAGLKNAVRNFLLKDNVLGSSVPLSHLQEELNRFDKTPLSKCEYLYAEVILRFTLGLRTQMSMGNHLFRMRFIPEVTCLFVGHYLIIKPLLNRRYPQGIFTQHVTLQQRNRALPLKKEAQAEIKMLKESYYAKRKFLSVAIPAGKIIFGVLIAEYFLSTNTSLFRMFIALSAAMVALSEWLFKDLFAGQQKLSQRNLEEIKKILPLWKNEFNVEYKIYQELSPDPDSAYVIFTFGKYKDYSEKEMRRLFEGLFLHFGMEVDGSALTFKTELAVLSLSKVANIFTSLSSLITQERLVSWLERERKLNKLLAQLWDLEEFPFLFLRYELKISSEFDKSYMVRLNIPVDLREDMKAIFSDEKIFDDLDKEKLEFKFEMQNPFPEEIWGMLCKLLGNYSTAKVKPNSERASIPQETQSSSPGIVKQKEKSKGKGNEKEKSSSSTTSSSSVEAKTPDRIIRWKSGTYDPSSKNNIVTRVGNSPWHYAVCFFSEKVDEDMGKALKQASHGFVGKEGQGIKRFKVPAKIRDIYGNRVDSTHKLKVGGRVLGWLGCAGYKEKAETGEVLHVFSENNIYNRHPGRK